MKRRRLMIGSGLALAGLLPAVAPALAAPAQRGDKVLWPAITLLDGRVVAAEALRDTATVVVFFSTTCPFCKRHNQHVDKLARATAGRGLQVIAAAHDRQSVPVRQYLASQGYAFEATLDATPLHAALSERRVIPLTCVIDRQGLLREVIAGEMFEEDVLELARWARA